uniref:ATPase 13A5 n=1 Tax=Gopherus evgoodei TaxID=1825980 RepID=A0A8C5EYK9_9SAUR
TTGFLTSVCLTAPWVSSHYLVPGDILVLEGKKHALPCDAILIDGGCIVDEGMLTGESIPVTKTPLPHMENTKSWKTHSAEDYRRHVLFCGTEVIQTKDAFKFIIILTLIGVLGLIYTVCVYKPVAETVAMALLLFTVSVPPAIPAALTTGIVYAQKRLKNKKIFCISPQRINICGQINLVCFDKVRNILLLLNALCRAITGSKRGPHSRRTLPPDWTQTMVHPDTASRLISGSFCGFYINSVVF